jgi:hypothetical protein
MFRLPIAAMVLGVCLLRADTLEQIKIDFHEFDQPLSSPANVGNYYAGGSGVSGTNGLPGPDYGLYDAVTAFSPHWVTFGNSGSFLYRGVGQIAASRGLFNSVSMLIKGGFPGDPPDAFPIAVRDASGSIIGSTRIGYSITYQPITISLLGEGDTITFGDANYFFAQYFDFTDLVTYVPMADAPATAPEPGYAVMAGVGLLLVGAFRKHPNAKVSTNRTP